jgi:hypothetical protein
MLSSFVEISLLKAISFISLSLSNILQTININHCKIQTVLIRIWVSFKLKFR